MDRWFDAVCDATRAEAKVSPTLSTEDYAAAYDTREKEKERRVINVDLAYMSSHAFALYPFTLEVCVLTLESPRGLSGF